VKRILDAALGDGYSAQNVAFGMGGGLLQKINRDTMSFATKLSYIEYKDGTKRDVMKLPKTDSGKTSLPGMLRVVSDPTTGLCSIIPKNSVDQQPGKDDLLKVVYDGKPKEGIWDDFQTIRNRVQTQWNKMPKVYDPVSSELHTKIDEWTKQHKKFMAETYK